MRPAREDILLLFVLSWLCVPSSQIGALGEVCISLLGHWCRAHHWQKCNLFNVENIQASVYCVLPPECCSYLVPDVHNRLQLGTGKLLLFVYFISSTMMPHSAGGAEVQISTLSSRFLPMVILLGEKNSICIHVDS